MKFSILSLGKSVASALQVGANFAAVCGLLAAIYAFIYPASVADYGAEVLKLMQQTGADVAAIKESSAETAENTGATADNTAKLAAAIPSWISYQFGQVGLQGFPSYFLFSNDSPGRVDFSIKFFVDGELLDNSSVFVLAGESATVDAPESLSAGQNFSELMLCLSGKNQRLPETVFYERRIFRSATPQADLGEMVAADIQFEPFADCE
jgi:hypothetical protein